MSLKASLTWPRMPWITIVVLVLLLGLAVWQVQTSGTAYVLLGSWQSAQFGRQFPALTVTLIVLIPLLLIIAGVALFGRSQPATADPAERALAGSTRLFRMLAAASGVALLSTLIVLFVMLMLPREGSPRLIDAHTVNDPHSTAAIVAGPLIHGRVIRFEESIGTASRIYSFAPIAPGAADGGAIRYFVEVTDVPDTETSTHPGILMRNGLPRSAKAAIEAAGYRVAEPNAVVYRDSASMRWPYSVLMAQLVLVAAVLLLATTIQLVVIRRIRYAISTMP